MAISKLYSQFWSLEALWSLEDVALVYWSYCTTLWYWMCWLGVFITPNAPYSRWTSTTKSAMFSGAPILKQCLVRVYQTSDSSSCQIIFSLAKLSFLQSRIRESPLSFREGSHKILTFLKLSGSWSIWFSRIIVPYWHRTPKPENFKWPYDMAIPIKFAVEALIFARNLHFPFNLRIHT